MSHQPPTPRASQTVVVWFCEGVKCGPAALCLEQWDVYHTGAAQGLGWFPHLQLLCWGEFVLGQVGLSGALACPGDAGVVGEGCWSGQRGMLEWSVWDAGGTDLGCRSV